MNLTISIKNVFFFQNVLWVTYNIGSCRMECIELFAIKTTVTNISTLNVLSYVARQRIKKCLTTIILH